MATIDNIRRIVREDFPEEDQETVGKIADIINNFMEQVKNAFEKDIDFSNLSQEVRTFECYVDSTGQPVTTSGGKIDLVIKTDYVSGTVNRLVVNVENLTNPSNLPKTQPIVHMSVTGNNTYKINKIYGLAGLGQVDVKVESTADVPLTGGASLTINSVVLASGDKILLKDQTTAAQNGVYVVSGIGASYVLLRDSDVELAYNLSIYSKYSKTAYKITTKGDIDPDTTPITFSTGSTKLEKHRITLLLFGK